MFLKTRLALIFSLILIILVGCSQNKSPVVAKVGGKIEITLEDFNKNFSKRRSDEQVRNATLEEKEEHLDRMISQYLEILKAYDLKMDEDSTVLAETKRTRDKYLTDALFKKEIIDKIIPEKDIRDYYEKSKKKVVVRNILFKCPQDSSDEVAKEVELRAKDALSRIKKGEPFPRVAREVSEDDKTTANGGLLGTLSWKSNGSLFLETAFKLKENDVSDVFRTDKGFNIIKVDKIIPQEERPFDEASGYIRDMMKREKAQEINEKAQEYLNQLMKKHQLIYNEDALNQFAKLMEPVASETADIVLAHVETLPDSIMDVVLVQYDTGDFRVKDLKELKKRIPSDAYLNLNEVLGIKYTIERWLANPFLVDEAIRLKVDKQDHIKALIKSNLENAMVKRMLRREVYEKITVTDEEKKAYYEAHKEERYSRPDRFKIQEILVKDRILAENIKKWIEEGKDMGKLAQEYTIRPGFKNKKGITNYFPKTQWGEVGEVAQTLDKGELAGPIKSKSGYSVIRLLSKKRARSEPYVRIKNQVYRDCFFDKRKQGKTDFVEQLKKEYSIEKNLEPLQG